MPETESLLGVGVGVAGTGVLAGVGIGGTGVLVGVTVDTPMGIKVAVGMTEIWP